MALIRCWAAVSNVILRTENLVTCHSCAWSSVHQIRLRGRNFSRCHFGCARLYFSNLWLIQIVAGTRKLILQVCADKHKSDREVKSFRKLLPGPSISFCPFGYNINSSSFHYRGSWPNVWLDVNSSSGNMKVQYQSYSAVIWALSSSMEKKTAIDCIEVTLYLSIP